MRRPGVTDSFQTRAAPSGKRELAGISFNRAAGALRQRSGRAGGGVLDSSYSQGQALIWADPHAGYQEINTALPSLRLR